MMRDKLFALVSTVLIVATGLAVHTMAGSGKAGSPANQILEFTDVQKQTHEFMAYNKSIVLTPDQERIYKTALSALPAPCCSNKTAYTCCCPCNMAQAWWGLSKHLIADMDYDANAVRAKVGEWFKFINPDGFTGDACYTGGCNRPSGSNGCGGMNEKKVIF